MRRFFGKPMSGVFSRSWERNVRDVRIEPCDKNIDPQGYRAVFVLTHEAQDEMQRVFYIGASLLEQRVRQIRQAGYRAPMTERALSMLERNKSKAEITVE